MDFKERQEFIDAIENLWLENHVAREYLRTECKIADPDTLLKTRVAKIPADALAHEIFQPVRQVIGQSLQDSEVLQALLKVLQEASKK